MSTTYICETEVKTNEHEIYVGKLSGLFEATAQKSINDTPTLGKQRNLIAKHVN